MQLSKDLPLTPAKKERDVSLDTLKGFAIALVIAIHISIFFLDIHNVHSKTRSALIVIDVLSQCAVPLFLFIAGYLENKSYNRSKIDLFTYYKKKLSRIIPLYVLFTVFYYMYTHPSGNYSVIEFLSGLVNGTTYAHLWFIPVIILTYILSPLIMQIKNEVGDKHLFQFALITLPILAFLIPTFSGNIYNTFPASIILFFILGASYRPEFIAILARKRVLLGALFIALITALGTAYLWHRVGASLETFSGRSVPVRMAESILMAITHTIIILCLFYYRTTVTHWINKFHILQQAGVMSFEMYFVQGYFIIVAKQILDTHQIAIDKFYFYLLLYPMAFAFSFIGAFILSKLVSLMLYRPVQSVAHTQAS